MLLKFSKVDICSTQTSSCIGHATNPKGQGQEVQAEELREINQRRQSKYIQSNFNGSNSFRTMKICFETGIDQAKEG